VNALTANGADGRERVVVENLEPIVDGGDFPAKRSLGEEVIVEADCFTDGHDHLACVLRYRADDASSEWRETPMAALGNDRWRAQFTVDRLGVWRYEVHAWIDHLDSWRHEFERRVDLEDLQIAAQTGADLIIAAAQRAEGAARKHLAAWAVKLRKARTAAALRKLALDDELFAVAQAYPDRSLATKSEKELRIAVDPPRATFSSWYELFPRSTAEAPDTHGTLNDVIKRLDYVAEMGFDVLYLPPIHPIGRERRKGKNNAVTAADADVGSPWAIGAAEGGHKAIHPALGTFEDFRHLVEAARSRGIEVALDIALQVAPDHPYVAQHPAWFRWRADGTVQYAENPPKKYQDIYPFNFESEEWRALWEELRSIFTFWIGEGVRIFRVDNPHTKPFPFWEWAITETKREFPDVIFLAEAFTRPRVMHRLAKLGFTQSYTYFTWRNTKQELTEYFTELAHGPGAEYFRPNCWPNTPDILPEHLQIGGTPAFMTRLVLAATLSANYGIYGPAFELMEHTARDPGSEEYLDSEKYEIRNWNLAQTDSLAPFITRVNRIRHANPALQSNRSLAFHRIDNEALICYSKSAGTNTIIVIANLDYYNVQSGWVELDLAELDIEPDTGYQMHDLLSGARYPWHGSRNFVRLDPAHQPAHILQLRRRSRSERDFDYFL
jgi:starch synthase (maltosyl-transferring)